MRRTESSVWQIGIWPSKSKDRWRDRRTRDWLVGDAGEDKKEKEKEQANRECFRSRVGGIWLDSKWTLENELIAQHKWLPLEANIFRCFEGPINGRRNRYLETKPRRD